MSDYCVIPAGYTAVIIDDNMFARRLLATMLKQIGFTTILEADSGMAGVEMLLKTQPDLTLLDWIMPDKDGADVLQLLTACDHPYDSSPVMVTSTIATRDSIVRAARLGAAGFIVKPFATPTLANRVGRIMEARDEAMTKPAEEEVAATGISA